MFLRVTRAGFQNVCGRLRRKNIMINGHGAITTVFLSPENQIYRPSLKKNNASQLK